MAGLGLENWARIGVSLVVLLFYLITFFLLIEIKKRTKQRIKQTFMYLTIGIVILIIIRILDVFNKIGLLVVPFLHEVLVLTWSFFLFLAIFYYLKFLKKLTDGRFKK